MIPPMRRNIADILLLLVCCVFVNFSLQAQSIQYDATRKPFLLSTSQSSYAVEIGPKSELESVYWGPKLPAVDDFAAAPRHDISSFDPTQMLDNQGVSRMGRTFIRKSRR